MVRSGSILTSTKKEEGDKDKAGAVTGLFPVGQTLEQEPREAVASPSLELLETRQGRALSN